MAKYAELLRDPRWQRKRLEILQRDDFACRQCSETGKTLHVHHCYYQRGTLPWDYPSTSLVTLCWECHETESGLYGSNGDYHPLLRDLASLGMTGANLEWLSVCFYKCKFDKEFKDGRDLFAILEALFANETFYKKCLSLVKASTEERSVA